jgi:hypothetical protein
MGTPHAGKDTAKEVGREVIVEGGCPEDGVLRFFFDFLGRYLGDEMFLDAGFTRERPDGSFIFI